MTLINTDGMAFLGPGSEWFWTMAQFVVVVVTLLAIYRQLRAQAAANALVRYQTFYAEYESREMTLAKLQVAIRLRHETDSAEMDRRVDRIANFFDVLHDQYKAGFVTLAEIDERFGGGAQIWWRLLHPAIERSRAIENEPGLAEGFENIERLCGNRAEQRGFRRSWILDSPRTELLDEMIKRTTEQLELLRQVASDYIPREPTTETPSESGGVPRGRGS